jgi:hypothetical protein
MNTPTLFSNGAASSAIVTGVAALALLANITNNGSTPRFYWLIDSTGVPGASANGSWAATGINSQTAIQPSGTWTPFPIGAKSTLAVSSGLVFASYAYGLTVTAATNAAPIVITTSVAHGLQNGQLVTITGVGGNTNANGTFSVAVLSPTTVALYSASIPNVQIAGNGAYTSGGVVQITGAPVNPFYGSLSAADASVSIWYANLS